MIIVGINAFLEFIMYIFTAITGIVVSLFLWWLFEK